MGLAKPQPEAQGWSVQGRAGRAAAPGWQRLAAAVLSTLLPAAGRTTRTLADHIRLHRLQRARARIIEGGVGVLLCRAEALWRGTDISEGGAERPWRQPAAWTQRAVPTAHCHRHLALQWHWTHRPRCHLPFGYRLDPAAARGVGGGGARRTAPRRQARQHTPASGAPPLARKGACSSPCRCVALRPAEEAGVAGPIRVLAVLAVLAGPIPHNRQAVPLRASASKS